ncbi:helix-turn-helix domain-containing protein [Olivibacter sitiensis]|uniref:helix-turn-helix domain-containing protein n=1 Tax=Olivibacter sitiensis TaxID=376470 RepID=UPI0004160CC3|nr:helix-turn-helix domain-containing protein [Olivibacter sitiensis]
MDTSIGQRIKAMRIKKGLSQEELANMSKLSLRTIQRVENGKTEPRGFTLKRLSEVLEIPMDRLMATVLHEDRGMLVILNLSPMAFLIFPLLGILAPFVFWTLYRHKINGVDEQGKSILNFQLTLNIVALIILLNLATGWPYPILRLLPFNKGIIGNAEFMLLFLFLFYYVFNLATIGWNVFRIFKDKAIVYRPAIPLIK